MPQQETFWVYGHPITHDSLLNIKLSDGHDAIDGCRWCTPTVEISPQAPQLALVTATHTPECPITNKEN
ncbi:hypothetical protein G9E11_12205 [Arthrobacter sp. IA7]|uniref:hypothetical protein n=1 Tax=Arthrobacter ipis TaxID=2716202 RepID=UPI0016841D9B|nr:hypothetical protein [Arthrobacter ipis]MBD1542994.1 hypothetical protein [Arthrobacter ipis]